MISFTSLPLYPRGRRTRWPLDRRLGGPYSRSGRSGVTNQNLINEKIKSRLNSDNACYHSVQNLSSSRLLSKNVKIKIQKTVILLVVLYGCETRIFTLREEHRLRMFDNRILRDLRN
jgi:hypothetical protein